MTRMYIIPTGANDNYKTILTQRVWGLTPYYKDLVHRMQADGGVALFMAPKPVIAASYGGMDEAGVYAVGRLKECVPIGREDAERIWKPRPHNSIIHHNEFAYAIHFDVVRELKTPLTKSELKALMNRADSLDRMQQAMEVDAEYVENILWAVASRV